MFLHQSLRNAVLRSPPSEKRAGGGESGSGAHSEFLSAHSPVTTTTTSLVQPVKISLLILSTSYSGDWITYRIWLLLWPTRGVRHKVMVLACGPKGRDDADGKKRKAGSKETEEERDEGVCKLTGEDHGVQTVAWKKKDLGHDREGGL